MRTMSIPRLELQAAVLGTRLMDTVKREHSVAISDIVLWTDSKTVLRWIGSTHRRYKQFVGNRVAEILESTKVAQWRWVPTADNAADDATRSQCHVDLSQKSRWLGGPAFLRQPAGSWPQPEAGFKRVPDDNDEEEMPKILKLQSATQDYSLGEAAENLLVRQAQWKRHSRTGAIHRWPWSSASIRQSGCRIVFAIQCEEANNPVTQAQSYGDDCASFPRQDEASKRGCYDCGDPNKVLDYEAETCTTEDDLSMQRVQVASGAGCAANNGTPAEGSPGGQWLAI
ncbi:uncharacterized protein LOC117193727 isoform X3 [Drosophila miranda]|uniref:uncharacterized protein LOC117193727 isoform X3 n=1 Tax=Drosophila miranda TaxID=7229 RepID=UPI00143F1FE5|nr:uncharacterized protein LOC117193727 isoform X3 [Drosophila miranda]